MRISDWSSDVCSSDLPGASAMARRPTKRRTRRSDGPAAPLTEAQLKRKVRARAALKKPEKMTLRIDMMMAGDPKVSYRSEEHTSELQSLMRISYAVFCLKKKN